MDRGPPTTNTAWQGAGLLPSAPSHGDPGSPQNAAERCAAAAAAAERRTLFAEATPDCGVVTSGAQTLNQSRATIAATLPGAPIEPQDIYITAEKSCAASQLGARVLAPRAPTPLDLLFVHVPKYAIPAFPLVLDVAPSDSYPCDSPEEVGVFTRFLAAHLQVSASFYGGSAAAEALQPALEPRGGGLPGVRASFPAAWGPADVGVASVVIPAESVLLAGVCVRSPCLYARVPVGANHAKAPPGPLCDAVGEGDVARVVAALSAGCSTEEGAYRRPGSDM